MLQSAWVRNLLLAIVVSLLLLFIIGKILKIYTRHNENVTVPDLIGKMPEDLENLGLTGDFRILVIDSVFDQEKAGGSIVFQEPPANSVVKKDRTIYLTLVANSKEKVKMPALTDLTLRQAGSVLETYGLKLGNTEYVSNMARNAVVGQFFRHKPIREGEWVLKGSRIDLQIGDGGLGTEGMTGDPDSLTMEADSL